MEGGRGGGGRTPRGKKFRGSSRGRGQDSPARTPTTSSPVSSPVHQSPSVTSSTPTPPVSTPTPLVSTPTPPVSTPTPPVSTPTLPVSTPIPPVSTSSAPSVPTPSPRGVRDEDTKVTQPQSVDVSPTPAVTLSTKSTSVESTPSVSQQTTVTDSATSKMKSQSSDDASSETKQVSKDDVDKKNTETVSSVEEDSVGKLVEKQVSASESPAPAATTHTSAESDKNKEDLELPKPSTPPPTTGKVTPAKSKEDLEIPEPEPPQQEPQAKPSGDTGKKVTIESKVEQALAKPQQPRQTAKTLIVEPSKDVERSTDAPLSVEIESSIKSGEAGGPSSATSASPAPPQRSGSLSPGYAYPLYGPVGKPGYIGGVGGFDEQDESSDGEGRMRRQSAIAAMETAVKGFTKRQWILLIMFGLTDFLSAITISLQAPFYPAEAESKGATATEYGLVFGIFEFIVFLTSPIFGKYMNRLGPKTVFSVCILVTSVSVVCFGLLDRINDHTWFITLCFVCRIFEALGCGGFFTATFVIIAMEFPESVATTFASLETFFGLGLIVGPTVGGALFEVGGFSLPFFVVGACLLLTGLLSGLVMPKIDRACDEYGAEEKGYGIWTILKIPSVALVALSIASTSMSLGFVSATLEPHIRSFGLTPLQTGLVFIINGGMYALTAPLWGYICDYIRRPVYITIIGNFFIFTSFLLIGPADFMPFDTILWVTIIGLVIQGLGFGCCLVSGFIVGLKDSMKNGLPDNMSTYSVASGLWTSMISLGAWLGPSLAGILYDHVGFREGSWLILVTSMVVGVTILIHTCVTSPDLKTDLESQPLLQPTPISPLLGKKDVEESQASKPSMSYGSTTHTGGGGDAAV